MRHFTEHFEFTGHRNTTLLYRIPDFNSNTIIGTVIHNILGNVAEKDMFLMILKKMIPKSCFSI